jgi:hypothetical protein
VITVAKKLGFTEPQHMFTGRDKEAAFNQSALLFPGFIPERAAMVFWGLA